MTAFAYERIGAGPIRSADQTAESRKRVRSFWLQCDYAKGTLAERYLVKRGLPWLAQCEHVRFRGDCPHPDGSRLPAMVCLVHDAVGNIAAVHRTFLDPSGIKAKIPTAKASVGSFAGGAIRVHPACAELVVAEGLETAASAAVILGLPGWAAIACGNLGYSMQLPALVRKVTIASDNDPPGKRAATRAALRWRKEGRQVRIVQPNARGQDFNDVLLERGGDAHAG